MSGLKPVFAKDGSVTAANASGINDGAAAVLVMSEARASALGLEPLARIRAYASAGLDPAYMGLGPVPASRRCLERAGCFANAFHICGELPEHARMLAKGVGQGQPSRHIGCDPRGDPTKRNAVTLFG